MTIPFSNLKTMNVWDQIRKVLEASLSVQSYQNWLSRTAYGRLENGVLHVAVPDEETKRWLETEYSSQIHSAAQQLGLGIERVEFETASTPAAGVPELEEAAPVSLLNPRFTFDNFVVGASNQFAHA